MYTTGGTRRAVTALDAATGEQLWVYSLNEGQRGLDAPRKLSGRGLAFWQKGRDKRVLFVTPGYQLVAVDAATGRPVPGFGKSGIVDLRDTLDGRRLGREPDWHELAADRGRRRRDRRRGAHAVRARRPGRTT